MQLETPGIHHVTAIGRDAQQHLDYWSGLLRLRLVKLTLKVDTGDAYHLFFGDQTGSPGSVHTVFPYPNARVGQPGAGQFVDASFAIPVNRLADWTQYLVDRGVEIDGPDQRFGDPVVRFVDPDGMVFYLVGVETEADHISHFESVGLVSREPERTAVFLNEVLNFSPGGRDGNRERFLTDGGGVSARLDLIHEAAPRAMGGVGTFHHVAWRARDSDELLAWREHLLLNRVAVSKVKDRKYFQSIYFREPGGALFEIATDGPGFLLDETVETLGSGLRLPPSYEDRRVEIESQLPRITLPSGIKVPVNEA